jgi:hypothetical protein
MGASTRLISAVPRNATPPPILNLLGRLTNKDNIDLRDKGELEKKCKGCARRGIYTHQNMCRDAVPSQLLLKMNRPFLSSIMVSPPTTIHPSASRDVGVMGSLGLAWISHMTLWLWVQFTAVRIRQLGQFPHCRRAYVPDPKLKLFLHGKNHDISVEIRVWSFKNGAGGGLGTQPQKPRAGSSLKPLLPMDPNHLIREQRAFGVRCEIVIHEHWDSDA